MGFFSRLMGREEKAQAILSTEALMAELSEFGRVKSGTMVNWKTALECSVALGCARVIANGLSQVPFRLYRKDGAVREAATDHRLYDKLYCAPNDFQTSFEFRQMIAMHLVLCGNAFVYAPRVGGRVVELLPFTPGSVTIITDPSVAWKRTYRISTVAEQIEVPASDMWHIRWMSWDGIAGFEGVKLMREAIGLALATESHGALLFRNGAQPKGMLSTDQVLKEDQRKALRASWQEAHGGENKFGTAVMYGGMKYSLVGIPNDQAQFLETRRHQVEEVCRGFGVMPIMVGHSDKASTYASAEQMFLHHLIHCLGPWYACVEQSATRWLLTEKERAEGYYAKFDAKALMRTTNKDRAEYFSKALGAGGGPAWMTQDEVRELEELNPMGGDAAILHKPSNVGDAPKEGDDDGKA